MLPKVGMALKSAYQKENMYYIEEIKDFLQRDNYLWSNGIFLVICPVKYRIKTLILVTHGN